MQEFNFYAKIWTEKCSLTEQTTARCYHIIRVLLYNIGGNGMNVTATETKKTVKSTFNDEFENYLKKQQIKTTFNGSELESFSWYKKALGLL